MKPDDAIHILSGLQKSLNEYCGLSNNGFETFNLAIEALEKQIPKKPERIPWQNFIGMICCCPTCGKALIDWHVKYCERCGQAILWGDEQDGI